MVRELSEHQGAFLFDCCVFIVRFASSSCYSSAKTRIRLVKSYQLVESTFGLLYCIGDFPYTPTGKLLPIYRSVQAARERYDNYDFYAIQLHILIEMAFGLMVKRWSILQRPITISIHNIKNLICSIGVLHNYCINEQIVHCSGNGISVPKKTNISPEEMVL